MHEIAVFGSTCPFMLAPISKAKLSGTGIAKN